MRLYTSSPRNLTNLNIHLKSELKYHKLITVITLQNLALHNCCWPDLSSSNFSSQCSELENDNVFICVVHRINGQ